jgi:hypothetical protein
MPSRAGRRWTHYVADGRLEVDNNPVGRIAELLPWNLPSDAEATTA